ncbi:MAG: UDP-N-acetylmuramoyl-L-alanine--D-glutamate ligase [Gammaproteobacteria bacterium]|nr:UDP-N-acetylmuramoyl-L-alanine--D-glutamate ligase [Gammaproteobacteria bacterium]
MSQNLHIVIGMGATGNACVRYLTGCNIPVAVVDTRPNPPQLAEFKKTYPTIPVQLGPLNDDFLSQAATLVVSPGVSLREPAIAKQIARGIPVIGDIELFAKAVNAPVIAITGTNAKSTVTTLVGKMAEAANLKAQVGGNLGIPALDLLTDPAPALYVLELSSFQLETTYTLAPKVAIVLNVTPDHMDRYDTLEAYQQAKLRVYTDCEVAVCNRDDPMTDCGDQFKQRKLQFTLQEPRHDEFGLLNKNGVMFLAFEDKPLMPVRELPILGRHYQANALAALALGYGFGLPMDAMLKTLVEFKGLVHRCQLVRERAGVRWYNDSKGTNVGATLAAIDGLGPEIEGKLVLIAGGVGKNADFSPLVPAITKYVKTVILIGEAAPVLAGVLSDRVDVILADSMQAAIIHAAKIAVSGDSVLLSPACASFDMFNNFEHRGNVFTEVVQELI